jgi:hypothetical protein
MRKSMKTNRKGQERNGKDDHITDLFFSSAAPCYILSVSYGNDSIALIQWAHEQGLENCFVVYADTGWAHPDWEERIKKGEALAEQYSFTTWRVRNRMQFAEWVKFKKMFPTNKYQWCTSYYKHSDRNRDKLIKKAGLKPLPHRSMECCPCVNAGRYDLRETPEICLERVRDLEQITGKTMYPVTRYMGASGIDEVMEWAASGRGKYNKRQSRLWNYRGEMCGSGMCGL